MHELMPTNLLLFECFETFLSLIRFANDLNALNNRLSASRLTRFRKNMKIFESVKRSAELFL